VRLKEDQNVGKEVIPPVNQQDVVDTNYQDSECNTMITPSGASQSLFSFSAFSRAKSKKDNADILLGGLSEF